MNSEPRRFAEYWKDKGYEKGESQPFWLNLLRDIFNIEHPEEYIKFEDKVKLDHTAFLDGYIDETHVLIEQKSRDKKLDKPIQQSDGSFLTPFEQAKRYSSELPYSKRPRWVITCNFQEFWIYDMERPNKKPEILLLENFANEYYRLEFIVDRAADHIQKEKELSVKAGEIVGKLYDMLYAQYAAYGEPSPEELRSLNELCVRLVFCLYAEDAGIFGGKDKFYKYLLQFDTAGMRQALINLFAVLNQKEEERDKFLREDLKAFPYVNGGLFANENIIIPQFTDEIKEMLLEEASFGFTWARISPTIFGAVFESTLNPETRRSGGMHYTSIENIHKVIDPLFLDELKEELEGVKNAGSDIKVKLAAKEFQKKLSKLKFIDPAAGSGNFLTETYLSLRNLENEVLRILYADNVSEILKDTRSVIKVDISQFYGIEINDFACSVAKTAMWIAESQMFQKTEGILGSETEFLPLHTNVNIVEGNALRIDWNDVIPASELNYIMGNPPFIGAKQWQKDSLKKEDMEICFGKKYYNLGILDYVSAWYKKAFEYMHNTNIKCAFVSTNSITQGEQNATLFRPLIENGLEFLFFYKQFRWDSEVSKKAQVYCVIIGFCSFRSNEFKNVYSADGSISRHSHLNNYFVEAPNCFITKRSKPLASISKIEKGNQPTDGGNLIIEQDEIEIWLNDKVASKYIRKLIGSTEYLHNKDRYCLWLVNANPSDIRASKLIKERLAKLKEFRLKSTDKKIVSMAEIGLFREQKNPERAIVIPVTTSENRHYIPIGFIDSSVITTNSLLIGQNATICEYGIIQSNVHMAWMRAVTGRMKNDYQYSASIVYNNFPWPSPTDEQKAKIEQTAQSILDARALYPDSSLADLYDPLTMPKELRDAHKANDKAVMAAYNFSQNMTESEIVAELMKMYQELVNKKK